MISDVWPVNGRAKFMLTDAGYVNTVGDDMTFNIIRGKCATTTGKGKGKKRFDLQAACCAPSRL